MGAGLHAQRRMHHGLRRRRQSALSPGHGACRDRQSHYDLPARRRQGLEKYRDLGRDVAVLSQLQVNDEVLERLGQKSAAVVATADEPPDFVFYTGCNVLKTPHIALLALDIMDRLGIRYQVMGGPSHCCGVVQLRPGDLNVRTDGNQEHRETLAFEIRRSDSWCPSCYVEFTETTLPALERQHGARPFEMTPFMRFLGQRIDQLTPHLREVAPMRVACIDTRRDWSDGGGREILGAIPGVTLVDLEQPVLGLEGVEPEGLYRLEREPR